MIRIWSVTIGAIAFGIAMVICSMMLVEQASQRTYQDFEKRITTLEKQVVLLGGNK